jgi:hypothetical protein
MARSSNLRPCLFLDRRGRVRAAFSPLASMQSGMVKGASKEMQRRAGAPEQRPRPSAFAFFNNEIPSRRHPMYLIYRLGEKYGRLTVTGLDDRGGQSRWYLCLCECGEARTVIERRLLSGEMVECMKCEVKRKMERPA